MVTQSAKKRQSRNGTSFSFNQDKPHKQHKMPLNNNLASFMHSHKNALLPLDEARIELK